MQLHIYICYIIIMSFYFGMVLKQQIANISEKRLIIMLIFAFSYLHLVRCPLKLQKYTILGWHCQAKTLSWPDCQMF